MQNKICITLLVLLPIIVQSISSDSYDQAGSSIVDRDKYDDIDVSKDKNHRKDDDYLPSSANRRGRISPSGTSSKNSYRSRGRPRRPSTFENLFDSNDRYGLGGLNLLSNLPGLSSPASIFDSNTFLNNGPGCHSLRDPQFPLFWELCGSVSPARYSLPNIYGHLDRWQIAQMLTAILGPSTPTSAVPACGISLRLLVCPLLFPPCATRYPGPPALPCQSFCRAVKTQCAAPSLEFLPCEILPPMSEVCPINPTPYSSMLSPFGQPSPFNGGLTPQTSPFSSMLGQSPFSPSGVSPSGASPSTMFPPGVNPSALSALLSSSGVPPSTISSLLSQSALSPSFFNQMPNGQSFMGDSLTPILVDFPPMGYGNDPRQASRYFPTTRSANERV